MRIVDKQGMKSLVLKGLLFFTFAFFLNSCEGLLDSCMTCQLNTYEAGVLSIPGADSEYCGVDLTAIQAIADVVDGTYTIKWECR